MMKTEAKFIVNGEEYTLDIKPNKTLIDLLRNDLGLTGTKRGCDSGECGACTVLVDGIPVLSCMTLACEVQGKQIETIEGIAQTKTYEPLLKSFLECGAIQCGYCTPGMIVSAVALLRKNPNPSREEIQKAISGNLCRCTGYVYIIEAIRKAAVRMKKVIYDR